MTRRALNHLAGHQNILLGFRSCITEENTVEIALHDVQDRELRPRRKSFEQHLDSRSIYNRFVNDNQISCVQPGALDGDAALELLFVGSVED